MKKNLGHWVNSLFSNQTGCTYENSRTHTARDVQKFSSERTFPVFIFADGIKNRLINERPPKAHKKRGQPYRLTSFPIASANMFLMKPSSTLRILVEMRGIEPLSENRSPKPSTSVVNF